MPNHSEPVHAGLLKPFRVLMMAPTVNGNICDPAWGTFLSCRAFRSARRGRYEQEPTLMPTLASS